MRFYRILVKKWFFNRTIDRTSSDLVHTQLCCASRAFVKQEYILAFLIAFAKITLGYLSLVLLFGLLISQRPRMLDFRPPIEFSIFISLGIFKVVLLFNYQCFVCFFRNSLFIISYLFFLVKNFFIFLFFQISFYFCVLRRSQRVGFLSYLFTPS